MPNLADFRVFDAFELVPCTPSSRPRRLLNMFKYGCSVVNKAERVEHCSRLFCKSQGWRVRLSRVSIVAQLRMRFESDILKSCGKGTNSCIKYEESIGFCIHNMTQPGSSLKRAGNLIEIFSDGFRKPEDERPEARAEQHNH
jgi:hypothetical protein